MRYFLRRLRACRLFPPGRFGCSLRVVLPAEIEDSEAFGGIGHAMPIRIGDRSPHIVVAAVPQVGHGRPRELVILEVYRTRVLPIVEMHECERQSSPRVRARTFITAHEAKPSRTSAHGDLANLLGPRAETTGPTGSSRLSSIARLESSKLTSLIDVRTNEQG